MKNLVARAAAVALFAALVACAPAPIVPSDPTTAPPTARSPDEFPRVASEQSGPAVLALLNQAEAELRAGASARAIAKLENAMRIESRNPFVWQRLAQAHLQVGRPDQAESLAQRSISLARGNPWLELDSWRVIAEARRRLGDRAGADAADAKVTALQERLDR